MANYYLSIDVGSTTLTAVIIDLDTSMLIGSSTVANTAELTSVVDKKKGRSEWDLEKMADLAISNAATLLANTGLQPAAIGITGQQQGLQLLDTQLNRIGRFISWQDQRAKELMPDGQTTYLERMGALGGADVNDGGLPAFANVGCPLVTGYTTPNLFWLKVNKQLPAGVHGITAPEFVVSRLTGKRPCTDPTDALSWGVYDVHKLEWDFTLIDGLGLPRSLFSTLAESCTVAGTLTCSMAQKLGIAVGTPVAVASGDHQCSFVGTVKDYENTVAVNVGTGGQASVYVEQPLARGWLELRPFIQSGYLLAGVGIVGGRTFRVLGDFFDKAIRSLTGQSIERDIIYERLVELAAAVPAGSEGVQAEPLFTGSRRKPRAKAAFCELTPGTFTAGHMARSLFEAMAVQLADSYREATRLGAGERVKLVGSGNGIKLNPVLREILATEFGMVMQLGIHNEAAAVGAALCAAVADGAFRSIATASAAFINTPIIKPVSR